MQDRSFVVLISEKALGPSVENIGKGLLALNGKGVSLRGAFDGGRTARRRCAACGTTCS